MMHDSKCGCPDCYGRNFRNFEGAASAGSAPEVPNAAELLASLRFLVAYTQEAHVRGGTPDHDCAFHSNPEAGHCDFHEAWWMAVERAGLLPDEMYAEERSDDAKNEPIPVLASPLSREELKAAVFKIANCQQGDDDLLCVDCGALLERIAQTARAYHDAQERYETEHALRLEDLDDQFKLRDELADALADRERLDWLEAHGWYFGAMAPGNARGFIDAVIGDGTRRQSSGQRSPDEGLNNG